MSSTRPPANGFIIWLSVALGLMLNIMPLPLWAENYRPEWVLLFLLVWAFETPHQLGVGTAFIAGILQSIVQDSTLGIASLAMMVPLFFAYRMSPRSAQFPLWQLAALVALLLALYELLSFWLTGFIGEPQSLRRLAASTLSGACIWPLLYFIARDLRARIGR